jgi:hypothetical protein
VAFSQTAIPAFARIAREFHTLEAGLGNLVLYGNAEDFCLLSGEDLAVRRQLCGKDSDDLILDRRVDLCLLFARTQARSQSNSRSRGDRPPRDPQKKVRAVIAGLLTALQGKSGKP